MGGLGGEWKGDEGSGLGMEDGMAGWGRGVVAEGEGERRGGKEAEMGEVGGRKGLL